MWLKYTLSCKTLTYLVFFFQECQMYVWSLQVYNVLNYFSLLSSSITMSGCLPISCSSTFLFSPALSSPVFLLFFSLPSLPLWCLPCSLPAPPSFLRQTFKHFLVCTSLTPMPHYRPMVLTVGFSPPLCLTLLSPIVNHLLFSVCSVFWIIVFLLLSLFSPSSWCCMVLHSSYNIVAVLWAHMYFLCSFSDGAVLVM